MKKILVVIDMQNDFIDGPLGTPEARAIVPNVCAKIREGEWDAIYTTRDTHDEMYHTTQEGLKLPVKHCLEGTDGWYLNDTINTEVINHIAPFYIPCKNTFGSINLIKDLGSYLDILNLLSDADLEIHMVGVCTDICVITNALLLKTYFPEATIIVDASCCAGTTPEMHRKALDVMRSCQIDIVND